MSKGQTAVFAGGFLSFSIDHDIASLGKKGASLRMILKTKGRGKYLHVTDTHFDSIVKHCPSACLLFEDEVDFTSFDLKITFRYFTINLFLLLKTFQSLPGKM